MKQAGWNHPGDANWIGVRTLYLREVRRFTKVWAQTLIAPMIIALLFLAVFSLAIGDRVGGLVGGVPFLDFLAPGLIMMAIAQNAFANSSSSIVVSKIQGNIVDTLMPPLTADELTLALAFGGATRGVCVGVVVALGTSIFVPLHFNNVGYIVFHGVMASLMLSLLGLIGGIWAEKFDHIATVTNFLITPLSFLSGTFYSIQRLPEAWQTAVHFNPFFYMIDGLRYGFIGSYDADPLLGLAVISGVNALLWLCCRQMFISGYKLKP